MSKSEPQDELTQYLIEQGYNEQEIKQIRAKVEEYDHRMLSDSVFDSIETGGFDLENLIQEALRDIDKDKTSTDGLGEDDGPNQT